MTEQTEFKVGDEVKWLGYETYGTGEIWGFKESETFGKRAHIRFSKFDGYGDYEENSPDTYGGLDFHEISIKSLVPVRTLAEKRADDRRVLEEAVNKLDNTLSSGGRDYYGGDTVMKFIEDMGLGFALGNATKYIARAGKKSADTKKSDLIKARDYISREIDKIGDAK